MLCRARQGFGYAEVRLVRAVMLAKADFLMLRTQRGRISARWQGTGLVITCEPSESTHHLCFLYSRRKRGVSMTMGEALPWNHAAYGAFFFHT
jgi:hypothetical protein